MPNFNYFAYGSNLHQQQMRLRCPEHLLLGTGFLEKHRIAFTQHSSDWGGGVADIVPHQQSTVWGLVYALSATDLQSLDAYEVFPKMYNRKLVQIQMLDGPVLECWSYYVVNPESFVKPSEKYLNVILESARSMHFAEEYLVNVIAAAGGK